MDEIEKKIKKTEEDESKLNRLIDVLIESYEVTGEQGELFPLLKKVDEEKKKREKEENTNRR